MRESTCLLGWGCIVMFPSFLPFCYPYISVPRPFCGAGGVSGRVSLPPAPPTPETKRRVWEPNCLHCRRVLALPHTHTHTHTHTHIISEPDPSHRSIERERESNKIWNLPKRWQRMRKRTSFSSNAPYTCAQSIHKSIFQLLVSLIHSIWE